MKFLTAIAAVTVIGTSFISVPVHADPHEYSLKVLTDDQFLKSKFPESNLNTSVEIRDFREGWCMAIDAVGQPQNQAIKDACASYGVVIAKNKTPAKASNPKPAPCRPNKACLATEGIDMLGQQRIAGWVMVEQPANQRVYYWEPTPKKVNVRGKTDRYIAWENVGHVYKKPTSGSAPRTTTIGTSRTNCTGYGNSINCTTTPATTITTGGSSGSPGGVVRYAFTYVLDCKEGTYASHQGNKVLGGWKKLNRNSWFGAISKTNCPIIDTLELSSFSKYAE